MLGLQDRNAQQDTELQEKNAEINRLWREPRVRDKRAVFDGLAVYILGCGWSDEVV